MQHQQTVGGHYLCCFPFFDSLLPLHVIVMFVGCSIDVNTGGLVGRDTPKNLGQRSLDLHEILSSYNGLEYEMGILSKR